MVSFEVKGGIAEARRILGRLQVFKIAKDLGGVVESLVELPAIMTHASIPKEEQKKPVSMTGSSACPSALKTSRTLSRIWNMP